MPKPAKIVKLINVTTNKRFPAFKTKKGIIIQLNSIKTGMPTGSTLSALVTFVEETGLKAVIVTGGTESSGHSKNSFHGKNLAIDIAGTKFNNLTHIDALNAAKKAGFTHGVYEDFRGTNKDHWHFQIGVGNGLGEKQSLNKANLYIKKY